MRIGIVTDAHLCPAGTPPAAWHNPYDFARAEDHLRHALTALQEQSVGLVAMLGDLTNAGDEPSIARGLRLCAAVGLPVSIVPGNHDCEEAVNRLASQLERTAAPALRLATPSGERRDGVRLAGLPIAEAEPGTDGSMAWPPIPDWGAEPVVLLSHFPVLSRAEECHRAGLRYAGHVAERAGIASALLGRSGPTVVLHGHLHIRDAVAIGPVLQIGCAALIEPPHEVATVEVATDGGALTVRVRHEPVAPSPPVQLPVLTGPSGAWAFAAGAWTRRFPDRGR